MDLQMSTRLPHYQYSSESIFAGREEKNSHDKCFAFMGNFKCD
jgi:hypothetical protein